MDIEKLVIYALKDTDCPLYDKVLNPTGIIPTIASLNNPEPRAPYLLINIINTRKIGLPFKSMIHEISNVKEHIFQVKEYLISLTLHAENKDVAQEWFRYFENGIHSDMNDWAFTKQGLSLVSATDMMYQHTPVSGVPYKRAIIDLTLRAEVQEEYRVNYLQSVAIDGTISGLKFTFFDNKGINDYVTLIGNPLNKLVNEDLPQALTINNK